MKETRVLLGTFLLITSMLAVGACSGEDLGTAPPLKDGGTTGEGDENDAWAPVREGGDGALANIPPTPDPAQGQDEGAEGAAEGAEGVQGPICKEVGQPCETDADCCEPTWKCQNNVCFDICAANPSADLACENDPCRFAPDSRDCACFRNPKSDKCLEPPKCRIPGDVTVACPDLHCCIEGCNGVSGCIQDCLRDANMIAPHGQCATCLQASDQCQRCNGCVNTDLSVNGSCVNDLCTSAYAACLPIGREFPAGDCSGTDESCQYVGGKTYACIPNGFPELSGAENAKHGACFPDRDACTGGTQCAPFTTSFCTVGCVPKADPPEAITGTPCGGLEDCLLGCGDPDVLDAATYRACRDKCYDDRAGCEQCNNNWIECLGEQDCFDVVGNPDITCAFKTCGALYTACYGENAADKFIQCPGLNDCLNSCPPTGTPAPGIPVVCGIDTNAVCANQCFAKTDYICDSCRSKLSRCLGEQGCVDEAGNANSICVFTKCKEYYDGCFGENPPPPTTTQCPTAQECQTKCSPFDANCPTNCQLADGPGCFACVQAQQRCWLENACVAVDGTSINQQCVDQFCKAYEVGCFGP